MLMSESTPHVPDMHGKRLLDVGNCTLRLSQPPSQPRSQQGEVEITVAAETQCKPKTLAEPASIQAGHSDGRVWIDTHVVGVAASATE